MRTRTQAGSCARRRRPRGCGLGLLIAAFLAVGATALAAPAPKVHSGKGRVDADSVAAPAPRVVAYYFFMNFRCPKCLKIEAWSREAIETAFAKELKEGRLVWRPLNVEEKGNEHFMKEYELYTKSIVIVDERGGRQVRWKNLEKVWQFLERKDDFLAYVREEVRAYLAEKS